MNAPHIGLDDGPAIYFDSSLSTLYAVATRTNANDGTDGAWLYIMYDCLADQPGWAGDGRSCNVTSPPQGIHVATDVSDHVNVITNPCTNHAIVAYFDTTSHTKLKVYTASGTFVGDMNQYPGYKGTGGAVYGCECGGDNVPKCGGACSTDCTANHQLGCMRMMTGKIQLAATYSTALRGGAGGCVLYEAFNAVHLGPDGKRHWKTELIILDITNEPSAYLVDHLVSSTDNSNDFEPTVTSSMWGGFTGWFYYKQPPLLVGADACNTIYTGKVVSEWGVDTSQFGPWTNLGTISGPFPSIRFGGNGFTAGAGDYTGIIKQGLPGGALYPTWSEPVRRDRAAPQCVSRHQCMGSDWSLRIMGATILGP